MLFFIHDPIHQRLLTISGTTLFGQMINPVGTHPVLIIVTIIISQIRLNTLILKKELPKFRAYLLKYFPWCI